MLGEKSSCLTLYQFVHFKRRNLARARGPSCEKAPGDAREASYCHGAKRIINDRVERDYY